MNVTWLFGLCAVVLFSLGVYALLAEPHVLRKVLGVNIASSGVFLLLIALADRGADGPDPVPHVLVLTGIVVAISATALALALARRIYAETGQRHLPPESPEAGGRK